MSLSIYFILLVVLLLFNLIFWVLIIWFRILFNCKLNTCCTEETSGRTTPTGHRNPAFVDNEDPVCTLPRPFTIERMESPPSYEEALKYDRFGFQFPTTINASSLSRPRESSQPQDINASTERRPHQMSQSPPTRSPETRSRSSTSCSMSHLTPIREEEDDALPVTVVIDNIGVQAARILSNCDTKVDIEGGQFLKEHSKC